MVLLQRCCAQTSALAVVLMIQMTAAVAVAQTRFGADRPDLSAASDTPESTGAFCIPTPDGFACEGQCGLPGEDCGPDELLTDEFGHLLEITCCSCERPECRLEVEPATGQFFCTSQCPTPDTECRLVGQGSADGTIRYSCECAEIPPQTDCKYEEVCNPNCPGTCVEQCTGICPNPDESCVPRVITEVVPGSGEFTVADCDCGPIGQDVCRPVIDAAGIVECIGDCPSPNQECELLVTDDPNGVSISYECLPCDPTDPTGACCYEDPLTGAPTCVETTASDCQQTFMGTYLGDGTDCVNHGQNCEEIISRFGACCFVDPATGLPGCLVTTPQVCQNQLNGTYQGDNTNCVPVDPCPDEQGACCYTDLAGNALCTVTTFNTCVEILQGQWQGVNTDCDPNPCTEEEGCDCPGNCDDRKPAYSDSAYAGFTDEVAVATMEGFFPGDFVLVNVDFKNRNLAPLNTNWNAATLYNHPDWTVANLGTIFGIALDNRGHTYVTASTTYYNDAMGIAGTMGAVYQINANSGAVSVFATLPNTGPGLGNIAYDAAGDQFFVTNFEDGRIYRIDSAGTCLSTYDHATGTIAAGCAPEAGDQPGFTPLGQRPWGVAVYNGRVYYGLWTEDLLRSSALAANSVWSIALAAGDFSGAPTMEVAVPALSGASSSTFPASMPISDISFSQTGCMLLAERGMGDDTSPYPHVARVLEYRQAITGAWAASSYTFEIGLGFALAPPTNAAGGIDFDADGNVVATGDYLQTNPQTIYGLQCLPCTGGDVSNSVLRDLNDVFTYSDKTRIGDVEIPCAEQCVNPPSRMVGWWPLDEPQTEFQAQDIVWDNDGSYQGTTAIPGMVAGARRFNGQSDRIRVPNHAVLNFGQGDFSIDAWVRNQGGGSSIQVIAEKRGGSGLNPQGYSLFLLNGQLAFQLGDGSTFGNYVRPGSIADGNWHHVTATVDRNDPNGLKLYVDGVATSFNPTSHAGSVSNNRSLWIGAREPAFGVVYYTGDIDEVEIFRRALRADEVLGLFQAGPGGKCKDRCSVPWDRTLCRNRSSVSTTVTICNDSPVPHTYAWNAAGTNDCSAPGAPTVSPGGGIVNVPAGGCVSVPLTVTQPAGMSPGQVACFSVNVFNLDTGHRFRCRGSIYKSHRWCPIIVIGTPIGLPIGIERRLNIPVTNEDDPGSPGNELLNYEVRVMRSDMDPDAPQVISLDGLPPGEPIVRTVKIPPGETADISFTALSLEHEPFVFYDIILMVDDDGDGEVEAIASIAVEATLPCGDFNRDGRIDLGDWPMFTECMAGPGGAANPACPQDVDADCNEDGDVDLGDFREYQESFGVITVPDDGS